MPPRKPAPKRNYRKRRNVRRKINYNKNAVFTKRDGPIKYFSTDSSSAGVTFVPNAASRVTYFELSNVSKGNLLDNRSSNNIRIKRVNGLFQMTNNAAIARHMRFLIIQLRGSTNTADTVTWTDLFRDPSSYAKSGPTGNPFDILQRINKDEYKVVYDKSVRVDGTADGISNNRVFRINKPMSSLVQYVYNSNDIRYNKTFMVIYCCEETGTSATATSVVMDYRLQTVFHDVQQ